LNHPAPAARPAAAAPNTLSLMDEAEVSTDVEMSRAVEAIRSVAEFELRELRAFTSALVGDMHVARDTNPLRPDVYVRALWAGAAALPVSRGFPVALLRHAAMPLAKLLRLAYAAACTRLEDAGVEPGAYSTIILPAGSRRSWPGQTAARTDLRELRDSVLGPLSIAQPLPAAPLRPDSQRMPLASHAGGIDQQLVDLLGRLFDSILADRAITPNVQVLLSRLQSLAMRVAARDDSLLESYAHPLWQFIDSVAFGDAAHPRSDDPQRLKLLDYTRSLIDQMLQSAAPDADTFAWGVKRLAALEHHLLTLRQKAAAAQIAALKALGEQPAPTAQAPLDVETLDTVRADLLPPGGTTDDTPEWLPSQLPGQWARLFLQGDWRVAQLMWHDDALWLYAESGGDTWALRRRALERLHAEGLAGSFRARSLVRRAAEVVMRQMTAPTSRH
jgi:hypothetical protein